MPIISIIIPAYNAERTILNTIVSVQQQTFSDFELIVINDGSTDRTLEILATIEESRLKVFSYSNGGLPVARNRGIAQATGDYISFIDADDLWTSDKLELQLTALQQQPEAGVAYSWTCNMGEKGESFHPGKSVMYTGNVLPQLLMSNFIASGSNILATKEAIATAGEFDPVLKSCEDWDFYLRLAARWSFVVVPKAQILYRQSAGAMSSKVEVMEKYHRLVLERAFKAAPAELQHLKNQSLAIMHEYLAGMSLSRVNNFQQVQQAGQHLQKAIRLHPQFLLKRTTQRYLMKWLLMRSLSPSIAKSMTKPLGRLRATGDPRLKH
jgi:glycosyltransferase involved in cell wall biosynthesis